ncbi:MAG TPA: hypothetical protein VK469_08980, partial [Candidatus Kapabacteria bacterium]|nr:hypothetical protein [Candidatus Kapabacteria bacterium]
MGEIGWVVLVIFCSICIFLAIKSKKDASEARLEKIVEEILKEENTESHEKVKAALDSIPSELSMEESNIVFPFLLKLKAFCKRRALAYFGSFGGCCDSCSAEISRDNFYFLGSWARCENCMDKALYKN